MSDGNVAAGAAGSAPLRQKSNGQIFLYTKEAHVGDATLKLLKEHGYIPVKVENMAAVRFLPSPLPQADLTLIQRAAFEAINECKSHESPRDLFGTKLAELLASAAKPADEGGHTP